MKIIEFKTKKTNENNKLLTARKRKDIDICMDGGVRLIQRCKCGKRIMRKDKLPKCLSCGDTLLLVGYLVDIRFRGKRVRIYSDKQGIPLDSRERANRILEGVRYEVDNDQFDHSKYIKGDQNEYRFNVRIKEWIKDYEKKKNRDEISLSYLNLLKRYNRMYYKPFFKGEDTREIKTKRIKDFTDSLPNKLSLKYRRNIIVALEKFFKDMHWLELLAKVPSFPTIKVPEPAINFCDIETQELILAKIPKADRPFLWFIAKQAVRPSEARALQWEDVDLKNDMVCIKRGFSGNELRETTKGKHADWIPLHPIVKQFMMALPRSISGYVFTYREKRYSESRARKLWNAACKELGIKGLTLYQGSRHSIASDAVQRGVSLYDVKDALRHKDIRTTVKYSHLKFEGKRRVITGGDVVKFPDKLEEK